MDDDTIAQQAYGIMGRAYEEYEGLQPNAHLVCLGVGGEVTRYNNDDAAVAYRFGDGSSAMVTDNGNSIVVIN